MPLFTAENAATMAARSVEARNKAKAQRAMILAQPALEARLTPDYAYSKAERARKQLDLVDDMIEQCCDADTLDSLTRSKERLFRIWAHLAGIPGPGNLKPTAPRQQRTQVVPQAIPEPVPYGLKLMPSSGSEPTSNSVPQGQPTPSTPQDSQMP